MHLRPHIVILAAGVLMGAAGLAQACPRHGAAAASHSVTAAQSPAAPARGALVAWRLRAWRPRAWAPAPSVALQSSGLWVSRDPVDGTYGMPDLSTLANQVVIDRTDDAPVLVDHLADGTLSAHLDERWADFAVATIGANGKPAWTCVPGPKGVAQFMTRPVITIVPAPERVDK